MRFLKLGGGKVGLGFIYWIKNNYTQSKTDRGERRMFFSVVYIYYTYGGDWRPMTKFHYPFVYYIVYKNTTNGNLLSKNFFKGFQLFRRLLPDYVKK